MTVEDPFVESRTFLECQVEALLKRQGEGDPFADGIEGYIRDSEQRHNGIVVLEKWPLVDRARYRETLVRDNLLRRVKVFYPLVIGTDLTNYLGVSVGFSLDDSGDFSERAGNVRVFRTTKQGNFDVAEYESGGFVRLRPNDQIGSGVLIERADLVLDQGRLDDHGIWRKLDLEGLHVIKRLDPPFGLGMTLPFNFDLNELAYQVLGYQVDKLREKDLPDFVLIKNFQLAARTKPLDPRLVTHHSQARHLVEICDRNKWELQNKDVLRLVNLWDEVHSGNRLEIPLDRNHLEFGKWLVDHDNVSDDRIDNGIPFPERVAPMLDLVPNDSGNGSHEALEVTPLDQRHLEFGRWLVQHERVSDQMNNGTPVLENAEVASNPRLEFARWLIKHRRLSDFPLENQI